MIDLHCHILPGVDDGSKEFEQSIKIAKEAEAAGFSKIYCTPHYMISNYTSSKEENKKILEELQQKINDNNINIQLKLANEIYINENVVDLINKNIVSKFENTDYILLELPMQRELKYLNEILDDIQDYNINIVLAHPERYKYIQDDPNRVIEFIERGIVLQSNYASLIGKYGTSAQKTLEKMLKAKMINILATDVHRDKSIYTYMDEILEKLNTLVDDEYYNILTKINPQRITDNEDIEFLKYKKIKKYFFI